MAKLKNEHLLLGLQFSFALFLFSFPHLYGYWTKRENYTPFSASENISSIVFDESSLYAAAVQKFLRNGNLFIEDIVEYSTFRTQYPLLPTILVGALSGMLGGLENAWVFLHVLSPALFWLLGYLVLGMFTRNVPFRSLMAWLLVLFSLGPRNFLMMSCDSFTQPIEITRLPAPGFCLPHLFFCSVISGWAVYRKEKWLCLVSGVLSGLLFYLYYFYWVAFFCGGFFLLMVALACGKKEDAKYLAMVGLSGAVVGAPSLILAWLDRETSQWIVLRNVMLNHTFSFEGFFYFIVGIGVIYWFLRKRAVLSREDWVGLFFLSMVVGVGFGMNLQIFTGHDLHHVHHFRNRVFQPLLVILTGIAFSWWLSQLIDAKVSRILQVFLGLIVVAMGLYRHVEVGRRTVAFHDKSDPRREVLDFAASNIPPDAVVGSIDREIVILTAITTGNWTYVPIGLRTKASNEEVLKRYFLMSYFVGDSREEAMKRLFMSSEDGGKLWLKTWLHYHFLLVLTLLPVLEESMDQWVRQLWERGPDGSEVQGRRLDYVILSNHQTSSRLSEYFGGAQEIYRNQDWHLVRLVSAP